MRRRGESTVVGAVVATLAAGVIVIRAAEPRMPSEPETCVDPDPVSMVAADAIGVDSLIDRIEAFGVFSGAVLIARGSDVLVHGGYGLASERPCIRAGPGSVFHIGSLAKQFAAAAVLLLEEQGRLAVTDPISRHLPHVPPDKQSITIHQLLTHSAGLRPNVGGYQSDYEPVERDTIIERILRSPLVHDPGERYEYSNAGYTLVAAIVEAAAGEPFQRYAERELFRRAELRQTGFVGDSSRFPPQTLARGLWGRYQVPSPLARPPNWSVFPGEVLSTVGDLHRWYRALRAGTVLDTANVRRMFTPYSGDYGYGWHVRTRADGSTPVIYHNGDSGEYAAAFRHYPGSDLITVALTNRAVQDVKQHDDVLNNALEVQGGEEIALPVLEASPAPSIREFAGEYSHDDGWTLQVSRDPAGQVWLAPYGDRPFEALYGHLPEFRTRYAAAVDRTTSFTESLYEQMDPSTCLEYGTPKWRGSSPQYVDAEQRLVCDLTRAWGAPVTVEAIGAAPLAWTDRRTLVFTLHVHEAGTQVVTWLWEEDRLVEAWTAEDVAQPQAVRLAPLPDAAGYHYIVFDWFTGVSVPIRFSLLDAGRRAVTVGSDEGELRAVYRGSGDAIED